MTPNKNHTASKCILGQIFQATTQQSWQSQQFKRAFNSLATLGAWSLRNHHKKCVFDLWCVSTFGEGFFAPLWGVSLVCSDSSILYLCHFFIVFTRACTAQLYGKALVGGYNKVTPHWRPGKVVFFKEQEGLAPLLRFIEKEKAEQILQSKARV